MYELHWTQKELWSKEVAGPKAQATRLARKKLAGTLLLNWEEHCVECAPPECYQSCPLYAPRADGNCARFAYGVYRNYAYQGLFDFGADIRFKQWAKLEADLHQASFSVSTLLHRLIQGLVGMSPKMYSLFYRIRQVRSLLKKSLVNDFDEFVLECYSAELHGFNLILEGYTPREGRREMKFRHSFPLVPGRNFYTIGADKFDLKDTQYLLIYPDNNDRECRIIFTWLDFVKYKEKPKPQETGPAEKVKCVAWDLDNTIWDGILAESNPDTLNFRPGIKETIKRFDERGVIQTIVSKNTHEEALAVLDRLGISGFFVYPAINWGQKSENLKQVAERLNINLDTFAVIDDTPFERAEVTQVLPQVRAYDEQNTLELLKLPEFDLPVTEESRQRRLSYLSEMKREKVKASFSGSYDEFLRSCKMALEIFIPKSQQEINRCLELIQRSNQLNLSTKRYEEDEFKNLLNDESKLCLGLRCKDKFGDYGIVGFVSVDLSEGQVMRDFVLSCRVAQKKVEQTFVQWLVGYLSGKIQQPLKARFIKTKKNEPMFSVLTQMPFKIEGKDNDEYCFELEPGKPILASPVMETLVSKELR